MGKEQKTKSSKAFTLVELLAVIVILGILSVVGITAVSKYIEKARNETNIEAKDTLLEKWGTVYGCVTDELKCKCIVDHRIPFCFSWDTDLQVTNKAAMCSKICAGLITADLKLQYCNQSPEILESLVQNNRYIPFEIIENRICEYYHKKMLSNSKKICRDCIFFERKCNGGCFIHKESIPIESIYSNTSLPVKRV